MLGPSAARCMYNNVVRERKKNGYVETSLSYARTHIHTFFLVCFYRLVAYKIPNVTAVVNPLQLA